MTAGTGVDSDPMDLLGFGDIDFNNASDDEDEEKQDEEWL